MSFTLDFDYTEIRTSWGQLFVSALCSFSDPGKLRLSGTRGTWGIELIS